MSADMIFVVGLIAVSVLFIAVAAVRSRRQTAPPPGNAEAPLLTSRATDGAETG
jgi:hypothetical protein